MPPKKYQPYGADIEMGPKSPAQRTFTRRITAVNLDISSMQKQVNDLFVLYDAGVECVGADQKREHKEKLQKLAGDIRSQASTAKSAAEEMRKENLQLEREAKAALESNNIEKLQRLVGNDSSSITSRNKRVNELLKALGDIGTQLQELDEHMRSKQREDVVNQLRDVLDLEVSEDVIDQVMDTPGALQQIMKNAMTSRSGVALESTLNDLQARLSTAQKLEQDVIAVATMFSEMKNMLAVQGEHINTIEKDIEEALSKQKIGTKAVEVAIKHVNTRRKLQIQVCVVVALVVIIAIILGTGLGMGWLFGEEQDGKKLNMSVQTPPASGSNTG